MSKATWKASAVIRQPEEVGNQTLERIIPPGQYFHSLFIGADFLALKDTVGEHGGTGELRAPGTTGWRSPPAKTPAVATRT